MAGEADVREVEAQRADRRRATSGPRWLTRETRLRIEFAFIALLSAVGFGRWIWGMLG